MDNFKKDKQVDNNSQPLQFTNKPQSSSSSNIQRIQQYEMVKFQDYDSYRYTTQDYNLPSTSSQIASSQRKELMNQLSPRHLKKLQRSLSPQKQYLARCQSNPVVGGIQVQSEDITQIQDLIRKIPQSHEKDVLLNSGLNTEITEHDKDEFMKQNVSTQENQNISKGFVNNLQPAKQPYTKFSEIVKQKQGQNEHQVFNQDQSFSICLDQDRQQLQQTISKMVDSDNLEFDQALGQDNQWREVTSKFNKKKDVIQYNDPLTLPIKYLQSQEQVHNNQRDFFQRLPYNHPQQVGLQQPAPQQQLQRQSSQNTQLSSRQIPSTPQSLNNNTQWDVPSYQTDELGFTSGNPEIEQIEGKLHLYRKVDTIKELNDVKPNTSTQDEAHFQQNCSILCVTAVPYTTSISDFCRFVGPHLKNMREVLVVRRHPPTHTTQSYMLVLKFINPDSAYHFYYDYCDRPFSSYEDVKCRLVFVHQIDLIEGNPASVFLEAHTELPSCPVCLDRLDPHITGIITTICQHKFHQDCFKEWGDVTCPVCRYQMEEITEGSKCSLCDAPENLWMCLVCGNVGCGRYKEKHAYQHFVETNHCFSLELETSRVWDYVGDHYVHRVIQSAVDGKLVEVPAPSFPRGKDVFEDGYVEQSICDPQKEKAMVSSKLDFVLQEYNNQVWQQLDSQRVHYEKLMQSKILEITEQNNSIQQQQCHTHASYKTQTQQQLNNLLSLQEQLLESKKSVKYFETKFKQASVQLQGIQKERDVLKVLADNLQQNQKLVNDKQQLIQAQNSKQNEDQNKKIKDLEEQVRDLMGYFQIQQTIQDNNEIQGASIVGTGQQEQTRYQKMKQKKEKKNLKQATK